MNPSSLRQSAPSVGGRHRRHRTRPAIPLGAGIAVVGASALLSTATVAPTAPAPTPLLAAATQPLVRADVSASISAMLNGLTAGLDAALQGWDSAVNLGADLVADLALTPAAIGVDVNTQLGAALQAVLAGLGPMDGTLLAPLLAGLASGGADFTALLNTLIGGAGDAVAWKAMLDAVLADLVSAGGVATLNGLDGLLLSLIGGTPAGLPDVDVTAALTAVVDHVALGLDAALQGWDTTVNLGADIVSTIALTAGATGAAGAGAVASAVLAALTALGPLAAPALPAITVLVNGIASAIGGGMAQAGALVDWKAQLDAVLADALSTGGVAAVNGLATGLLGAVGTEPVGLPPVSNADVSASVNAVVNHVTVTLPEVLRGDTAQSTPVVADKTVKPRAEMTSDAPPLSLPVDPPKTPGKASISLKPLGGLLAGPMKNRKPQASTGESTTTGASADGSSTPSAQSPSDSPAQ